MERASRLTLSRVHELPLARPGERNVTREADSWRAKVPDGLSITKEVHRVEVTNLEVV